MTIARALRAAGVTALLVASAAVLVTPGRTVADEAAGHTVTVGEGVDLFYRDEGEGPAIVFLPGLTFSGEVFEHQIDAFAADHRVIVVDPRSQGRSSKTAEGNNYPQHGRDLDAFFDALDLGEFVLVAWSFGAMSAWAYVDQFGLDRVKAVVTIDAPPNPMPDGDDENAWAQGTIPELKGGYHVVMTQEGHEAFFSGYRDHVMIQRELQPDEADWILSLSLQTPSTALADLYASGLFSNHLPTAQTIDATVPSLFVLAEHWRGVAEPYIAEHLPNTQVEVLGGHMMFWEYPGEFNARLRAFLSEHD